MQINVPVTRVRNLKFKFNIISCCPQLIQCSIGNPYTHRKYYVIIAS